MQRKIDGRDLRRLWVERIVWNMAAAAALAMMVALLLFSLQWLDEIDTSVGRDRDSIGLDREPDTQPPRIARAERTRG